MNDHQLWKFARKTCSSRNLMPTRAVFPAPIESQLFMTTSCTSTTLFHEVRR